MSITKLNARTLYALGFDKVSVEALLNMARVVGPSTTAPTVEEVAVDTDTTSVAVTNLQLVVAAVQLVLRELEAEDAKLPLPAPDHALHQRIGTLEAALENVSAENNKLSRRVADLENGVN